MRILRILLCLSLSTCLLAADFWKPITRWLTPAIPPPPAPAAPKPPVFPCSIAPLPPIVDTEALQFEASVNPSTTGLVPAMARALERFQKLVTSVGGTFLLRSAYRPPAYQAHLQQVWFKWMEVRNNNNPGCQELRSEVHTEFVGHRLMESQKPVTSSDHTRGLAFDATVEVPPASRLKKTSVNLDRLALLAGVVRPDVVRDPVHFKLVIVRAKQPPSTE